MYIYVVQTGDTIEEFADNFGVSVEKLIIDNGIENPDNLLVGRAIVIAYPSEIYVVKEGDTLSSIATSNDITVNELLRNNPFIIESPYIYPGEVLTISYNRSSRMAVYGYANSFIDRQTLRKTLPYLTFLSVYDYIIGENGETIGSGNDIDMVQMAIEHGVIPLLHLATITVQGVADLELTSRVLHEEDLQDRIFENVLEVLKDKGYYGVIISEQLIDSENDDLFYNYTKSEGYMTLIAIDPKISTNNGVVTFEPIDYARLSEVVYSILLLEYTWGVIDEPPSPVFSTHNVSTFLDTILPSVSPDKITIGIPLLGYIWSLPYVPGLTYGNSITIENVLTLAELYDVTIQFDEESQTPFYFIDDTDIGDGINIVWYVYTLTINSLTKILVENNVPAIGIWNIMSFFPSLWLVINSQYEIIKLLPEF